MIDRLTALPRWLLLVFAVLAAAVAISETEPLNSAHADTMRLHSHPKYRDLTAQGAAALRIEAVHSRFLARNALLSDLIRGESSLKEVTDAFLVLNRGNDALRAVIDATFSGQTHQERAARNVIFCAMSRLENEGDRQEVHARLTCELETMIGTEEN